MAKPVVRVTLRDEPPQVARGTVVEIEVMERKKPAAVYADLLTFTSPDFLELEKVLVVHCMIEVSHERYLCGREGRAGCQDTGLWAYISRLLLQAATMLGDYSPYMTWSATAVRTGKLVSQAQVLRNLITSLREVMLNVLRSGMVFEAPVWRVIDSSFEDVVRRSETLAWATDRVIAEYHGEVTELRFLSMDEYLTARVSGSRFSNHNDYTRAMKLAKKIGLDMSRLTLGLYQNLEVVAVVRGVKK